MTVPKKLSHIGNLLDEVFRNKGWSKRLELYAVFHFWNEVVGKDVAKRAQPHVIRGAVLWVKVSDPIWMQQLHLQKSILLEKINQRLRGEELSDIRFQLDAGLGKGPKPAAPTLDPMPTEPEPREIEKFDTMISSLSDPAVKKELKELWMKFSTTSNRKD